MKPQRFITTRALALSLLMLALLINVTNAQKSTSTPTTGQRNAIGIRLGTDPGITYKRYVANNGGIELMLHSGYRGLLFTGLYEWHLPVVTAPGLFFYLGVGGHVGFYDGWVVRRDRKGNPYRVYDYPNEPNFGVDFIVGIEYRIPSVPLTVGLDIKPSVDLYRSHTYGAYNGAFSFRYRF